MTKNIVLKECFHSPAAVSRPRCQKVQNGLCQSCLEALAVYDNVRTLKKLHRRKKNRASAALSKWKKEEKFSDLCAENVALAAQHEDLVQDLGKIEDTNNALAAAIAAKLQIIATLTPDQKFLKRPSSVTGSSH